MDPATGCISLKPLGPELARTRTWSGLPVLGWSQLFHKWFLLMLHFGKRRRLILAFVKTLEKTKIKKGYNLVLWSQHCNGKYDHCFTSLPSLQSASKAFQRLYSLYFDCVLLPLFLSALHHFAKIQLSFDTFRPYQSNVSFSITLSDLLKVDRSVDTKT